MKRLVDKRKEIHKQRSNGVVELQNHAVHTDVTSFRQKHDAVQKWERSPELSNKLRQTAITHLCLELELNSVIEL
jgi:hypothetical protein